MRPISFQRRRFPADMSRHAVWLCFQSTLSFRDVEELMAQRGVFTRNDFTPRGPTSANPPGGGGVAAWPSPPLRLEQPGSLRH